MSAADDEAVPLAPHGRGFEAFTSWATVVRADGVVQTRPPKYSELPSRASIQFPRGVGYRTAIEDLYEARQRGQELPANAEIASPLPEGVVLRVVEGRLTVDSAAPLGYDPGDGTVMTPEYTLPASLSPTQLKALFDEQRAMGLPMPRGATLLVPDLPLCQVLLESGASGACHDDRISPAEIDWALR
ncbi:hypothetical protein [Miltoncostaea oceani]|uniref:hypothetical protein n=1 Tax=Miltoncostaea oceani TaxID=2843216 RepID=UPI001C3DAFF4|nr:hypothetical protein [Miltoncostaea oceani]